MSLKVRFLKALHGDSILISCQSEKKLFTVLIDGGPRSAFTAQRPTDQREGALKRALDELIASNTKIDLVILTHIDDDHIGGLIKAFEHPKYLSVVADRVIFNSGQLIHEFFKVEHDATKQIIGNFEGSPQTSIKQGITLESLITKSGQWERKIIQQGSILNLDGVNISFLTPDEPSLTRLLGKWEAEQPDPFTSGEKDDYDKSYSELLSSDEFIEDNSIHNASSLSFILEFEGRRLLLLGDAYPSIVEKGLHHFGYSPEKPLDVELVKISHHGSKANTSYDLLRLIKTNIYVISTDGSRHRLPNKMTLARIHALNPSSKILFNYPHLIQKIYKPEELSLLGGRISAVEGELSFG